jgi:hypothetical protein
VDPSLPQLTDPFGVAQSETQVTGHELIFLCYDDQIDPGVHPAPFTTCNLPENPGLKRVERDAESRPPSEAKVRNGWNDVCTARYTFIARC